MQLDLQQKILSFGFPLKSKEGKDIYILHINHLIKNDSVIRFSTYEIILVCFVVHDFIAWPKVKQVLQNGRPLPRACKTIGSIN